MNRKISKIIVDVSNLVIQGEVLDMGFEGKGIIYRTLKENSSRDITDEAAVTSDFHGSTNEYDWVYGNSVDLPFEENRFNAVIAFFSISYLKKKHQRNKTIKEITRVLKAGGRLYMWDLNLKIPHFNTDNKINVILPEGNRASLDVDRLNRSWIYNINTILPVLERYFKIYKSEIYKDYFYIDAIKKEES